MSQHPRITLSRAEYEAQFGVRVDDIFTIGACLYGSTPDGMVILVEYLFLDAKEEIAVLEELLRA